MEEIIDLVNEMSPYLLLGFLLAGLMHAFVPKNLYGRYLGNSSFRSVFGAALLGIPLPLCSCGVIPTAMSLYRQGASKGATVSFLIATPQTGVDSIIATYSLMGLPFALIRPLAAFVTSLWGGLLVNQIEDKERILKSDIREDGDKVQNLSFFSRIVTALHYAFVEMMQDIGRWLILGLLVAGLITVFVPESFFALFADNSLLSMLLVLLCAIPMYLCATGSIPIAVALMLKGLSPGTALVLLMAGPAVNVASMLVIGKVMGQKTLLIYLLSIVGGAVIFGLGIDYLLPREWFVSSLEAMKSCHHEGPSYFNVCCSVLLLILLINAAIRRYYSRKRGNHECCETHCECSSDERVTENSPIKGCTLHVKGMSCNHCRTNVEKVIAALPGVEDVEVDLPTGVAVVRGEVDVMLVRKAVESIGFEVTES